MRRGEGTPPLIIAHRGAWEQAPQNSLEAVRQAAALGCDGIEIDVRRTADGHLVLVHDARLRGRPVGTLDREQVLARVRVGQAPLLHDVLDQAAGRLLVDVELKEDGYVAEVMTTIGQRMSPEQYVVTSFAPGLLAEAKRHLPDARTGLLLGPRAARQAARRLRESRADFLAPHLTLARAGILEWAVGRGLTCWVWTVNDARAVRTVGSHPAVAALITDRPAQALQIFTSC